MAPRLTCSGVLLGAAFSLLLLGASLGRRPESLPERGRAGGASPPHVPRTSRRRPSTCSPEVGGAPPRRVFTHVVFVLVKLAGLRPGPSSRTWHSAPGSSPRPTLRASRRRNPRFVLVKRWCPQPGRRLKRVAGAIGATLPPKRRGRGKMLLPRGPQRCVRREWAQNARASVLGRPEAAVACILSTLVSQNAGGTPVYTSRLPQILCGKPDLEGGPDTVLHANTPGALSPVWGRLEERASPRVSRTRGASPRPRCGRGSL